MVLDKGRKTLDTALRSGLQVEPIKSQFKTGRGKEDGGTLDLKKDSHPS